MGPADCGRRQVLGSAVSWWTWELDPGPGPSEGRPFRCISGWIWLVGTHRTVGSPVWGAMFQGQEEELPLVLCLAAQSSPTLCKKLGAWFFVLFCFVLFESNHHIIYKFYILIIRFQNTKLVLHTVPMERPPQQDSHRCCHERAAGCPPPLFAAWAATGF